MFLSRDRHGKPRRHVVPAAVIFLTGWAMSGHAQHLMLSTKMHATFGYTLMAAGVTRIAEVAVILRDQPYDKETQPRAFQYIPPFLLISSGLLFMGSNEEQIVMVNDAMVDAMSYSLVLFSLAFLVFFFANYLIFLYQSTGYNADDFKAGLENGNGHAYARANGGTNISNGNATHHHQSQHQPHDEFELGLMESDDEEEKLPPMTPETPQIGHV